MKNRIRYTGCLLFFTAVAMGQNLHLSTITYISKVPFIVKTGIYSNTLPPANHLYTLSGSLKIALAPRKRSIPADQYIRLDKPLPIGEYAKIEYACTDPSHPNPHWLPISMEEKLQKDFPYGNLLGDLSLSYADSATLSFRYRKTGQMIQQYLFYRPEILPELQAYRQTQKTDSIDNKIKSLTANDAKKKWMGFDSIRRKSIVLSPGKTLDLLIRKNNLSRDSCILYRIYKTANTTRPTWQLTGHLLTFPTLEPDSHYILELRYQDMRLFNSYELQTLPYWYQSPIGRSALSLIAITLLVAGPFTIYRMRMQRESEKRKKISEQLATVQAQLNPHFVFNALTSIEGLVTNQENDRANEYLASFSDIMRDTLKNSREPMIPLSQDLDTLEKYLRVEQLRFEFKWSMEIDPSLDLDGIEFPPMLLQPVVENAIKHGISGLGRNGLLTITIRQKGADLVITVKDNGGQKPEPAQHGQGYGLQLTRDRIERLRELYKKENITFNLRHYPNATLATYYFENWIPAYENSYY